MSAVAPFQTFGFLSYPGRPSPVDCCFPTVLIVQTGIRKFPFGSIQVFIRNILDSRSPDKDGRWREIRAARRRDSQYPALGFRFPGHPAP